MAKTILIVEDEKPLANALKEILTKDGFNVKVTYDGIQALNTLKKKEFDIILLDLLMPGLGGYDVLDIIHTEHKNTKVLIVSNLNREEEIQKAKEKGATDYILKSNVSLSYVVKKVKELLSD